MRFLFFVVQTLALCSPFLGVQAYGQLDPSSQLLLKASETMVPDTAGLESGRYKVRPRKKATQLPGKKVQGLSSDSSAAIDLATAVVLPSLPAEARSPESRKVDKKSYKKDQKSLELEQSLFVPGEKIQEKKDNFAVENGNKILPNISSYPVVESPPITDQVKDLVFGNGQPAVEAYKEQIHPDDNRLNRMEINIAPGVVADSSKSNYSFRTYSSFSPKVLLGAEFWMTPFLGVYGDYTTSLGADIVGEAATNSRISIQHEWVEVGFDIRRFFGMSRKANSIQFGVHISEYKFMVPSDDLNRVRLASNGIGLHLVTRIPVGPTYSWIFGGKIIPRVQHSESSTGINLSSGSPGESSRVDLSLGGELKLQRQNQITWSLTLSSEKDQFSGPASLSDPETGVAPKGVSVENTFTIFSMGYRWGQ